MWTGPHDEYLHTLEVHSNTLIQLERWFTPTGQTRVTVVGPLKARLWVMDMIRKVGSKNNLDQIKGRHLWQDPGGGHGASLFEDLLYVYESSICMYSCLRVEGIWSHEPPSGCWELKSGLLEEIQCFDASLGVAVKHHTSWRASGSSGKPEITQSAV